MSYNVLTGSIPAALTATNLQLNHNRFTSFTTSYCYSYQSMSYCCYWECYCCNGVYLAQCSVSRRYDMLLLGDNRMSTIDSCVTSSSCATVFTINFTTSILTSSPYTGKRIVFRLTLSNHIICCSPVYVSSPPAHEMFCD